MQGETVTIIRRVEKGVDPFNQPVYEQIEETVDNVLVAPSGQSNVTDESHPLGVVVAFTLYFPRSWTFTSLRHCLIRIDDTEYMVIGSPRPVDGGLKPTRWNLTVQVQEVEENTL